MADEDIYGNKRKYENFKGYYKKELISPTKKTRKYICSFPANLVYFEKLFIDFETKDISYIRRNTIIAKHAVYLSFCA